MPFNWFARTALCMCLLAGLAHATEPLQLADFKDCVGGNIRNFDSDCVLDSGTWAINSTIRIRRSNITVEGAWPYPTLLRTGGFNAELLATSNGTQWITFRNLTIDGNRHSGQSSVTAELNLIGCSYCRVESGMVFHASPRFSISTPPSSVVSIENAIFQDAAIGAMYNGPQSACPFPDQWYPAVCLSVLNSLFISSGSGAIGPEPKNATIAYNTFTGNHAECPFNAPGGQIDLDAGAAWVTVTRNTFENGPVCNNGWFASGIELHGTHLTLSDNIIRYNAAHGIGLDGAQHVTISSSDAAAYPIANNNRKGYGNFCDGAGFSGIDINRYSAAAGRPAFDINISGLWAVGGHAYGIRVWNCGAAASPVQDLSITHTCTAGNSAGIHDRANCGADGKQPCIGVPSHIDNNAAAGCGGY
jgi:hypothetical protein